MGHTADQSASSHTLPGYVSGSVFAVADGSDRAARILLSGPHQWPEQGERGENSGVHRISGAQESSLRRDTTGWRQAVHPPPLSLSHNIDHHEGPAKRCGRRAPNMLGSQMSEDRIRAINACAAFAGVGRMVLASCARKRMSSVICLCTGTVDEVVVCGIRMT